MLVIFVFCFIFFVLMQRTTDCVSILLPLDKNNASPKEFFVL